LRDTNAGNDVSGASVSAGWRVAELLGAWEGHVRLQLLSRQPRLHTEARPWCRQWCSIPLCGAIFAAWGGRILDNSSTALQLFSEVA